LVKVENVEVALEGALAAGGRKLSEIMPMDSLNGRFVLIEDTEGNAFELFADNS
jgi:predicted enzyme related to lactoylglutathione lyase